MDAYIISQSQVCPHMCVSRCIDQVTKCVRSSSGRVCSLKILLNSIVTTGVNGTESIEVSSVIDESGVVRQLMKPVEIMVFCVFYFIFKV